MLKTVSQRNTWDLIFELFRTDFKLKYNGSVLGFIWVLTKPFLIFMIMYIVISNIVGRGEVEYFGLYLLLGNIFFQFWIEGSTGGMESLLNRAALITKINFPRYIVLLSSTILSSVNFLISLGIYFVIAAFNQQIPSIIHFLWLLFCIGVLYLFILVLSMFISIMYVRFRDLKQIWELLGQIIFWATPIFYNPVKFEEISIFGIHIFKLIHDWFNPVSVMLRSGRNAILYDDITLQTNVFAWLAGTIVAGAFGYIYYTNKVKRIAEYF